ncbi:Wzz/FepE/Etk N-terminal domain-containing protein [Ferruginibacter sp. SUN002]|uniref:Wzz/FepE/Etk N-terminal domain-containing protein n=1 Tax=Ferruginibacter sp. SUN002 TaxID=2937789 RepID=UPI003D35ED0B
MSTADFIKAISARLSKAKLLIILVGIIVAVLLFFYAFRSKPAYTSRATVFPLNNQSQGSLAGNSLSSLLGMGDGSKSFSSDAAINIIELANSRNVREAVAAAKLQSINNKTIAELLINETNNNKGLFSSKIKIPADSAALVSIGGNILKSAVDAKINRNGVLELAFTNTNESLVKPVTEVIIAKISDFYINLRTQKAMDDYNFTVKKIDSLNLVVRGFDSRAIAMQNATFFTPDRLEYSLPKENLSGDRDRIKAQREAAIANRDEALWTLQKATPIISILDKPDPPFTVEKKSPVVWSIVGFVLGAIFTAILAVWGVLYGYVKSEIRKSIFAA